MKVTEIFRNIPKYFKIFRNISKYFGIFRNISEYFEIFRRINGRCHQIKKRRQHCNFDDVSELTGISDDVVAEIIIICADDSTAACIMKKNPGLEKSGLGEFTEKHKHFSII